MKSGQDLRQEIEEVIAYNNAASCSIIFRMDNTDGKPAVGEFIGSTERTIRKGYNLEVEFRINTDSYYFTTLEAVSQSDRKISRNDCVKFEELERNDKEGKFKYKITLLQDVKDILIQPKCYTLPAVESHSPANTKQTLTTDKPIKIYFNTPVNQDIKENVKIEILGTDVSDCFELPELNQDGTELTLTPKFDSLADFITNTLKVLTADVNISFDKSTTVRIGDKDLPLKQDDNSVFSVRYLGTKETTPPKKEDFFVTRNKIDLTSAKTETQKFSQAAIDLSPSTTDEKIVQNSSNGTIYIYGAYSGEDYGIDKVSIVEKRTNDQSAWFVSDVETITAEYTLENAEFTTDDAGNIYFCIKHELQAQKQDFEGAVSVKVLVYDICGNADEQSFTSIIKRNMTLDNLVIYNYTRVTQRVDGTYVFGNNEPVDIDEYNNNVKNIKFLKEEFPIKLYGNIDIPKEKFDLICEFTDHDGEIKRQRFENYDESKGIYNLTIDIDSVDALHFRLIYSDMLGLFADKSYNFPSCYTYISSISEDDYTYVVRPSGFMYSYARAIEVGPDGGRFLDCGVHYGRFDEFYKDPDYSYYFFDYQNFVEEGSNLVSELVSFEKVLEEYDNSSFEPGDISQEDLNVSKESDGDNTTYVTVQFTDDNLWNKYDMILYQLDGWGFGTIYSDTNSFCIRLTNSQLYEIDSEISIKGIAKHYENYDSYSIIDISDIVLYKEPEEDKTPPYIEVTRDSDKYVFNWCIRISDNESGATGTVTIGEEVKNLSGNDYIYVYYDDMMKNSIESNKNGIVREWHIPFYAIDSNNNSITSTYELLVEKQTRVENFNIDYRTSNQGKHTLYVDVDLDKYLYKYFYLFKYSTGETEGWEYVDRNAGSYYEGYENSAAGFYNQPMNTFFKIGFEESALYQYYYLGTQNTGKYDGLMSNGTSNSSVLIASDAPVFVHTLVTSRPYSECSVWALDDWEQFRKEIGLKVLQFSADEEHTMTDSEGESFIVNTGDHTPKRYDIPLKDIDDGQCYCVIAYFADGTSVMSQVMQK